jgi:TolB protein
MPVRTPIRALTVALAASAALAPAAQAESARESAQNTILISRAADGGLPDGPSTNAVISNDRRWARAIAFQSEASDLVAGDTNGVSDVFVVRRDGVFGNDGTQWFPGSTVLISRGRGGPANGTSWAPAIDGSFRARPKCVAFLSAASNLVPGDTNGKVDAFVSKLNGTGLKRVSLPGRRQSGFDSTGVAVSGNCSRVAFVTGGSVYVKAGRRIKRVGVGADPSFSTGQRQDLVYAAPSGVYLAKNGTGRPKLVAPGGSNPAYNDIKRRVVAYEKQAGGHNQVFYRDLGRGEHPASALGGQLGDADSRHPVIGNSGYYIAFESEADNLGVNALKRPGDENRRPDAYLYTNVRDLTLVQSVFEKAVPLAGGGYNPSMSFYANYILFDSPAPMGSIAGTHQVFMRYLGPL